jgi:hypothetical protein
MFLLADKINTFCGELVNQVKQILCIACETADLLGDYKVEFVLPGIGNHTVESMALSCGSACNTLVGCCQDKSKKKFKEIL